jgi:nucleoside-diphosphate-sugar epimerase
MSSNSSGLRVVVTGGSGKIGSFVVRELLQRGHEVINVDRRAPASPPASAPTSAADTRRPARFVYADLRDRAQVQPLFENADAVCHLGEIPGMHLSTPPEELYSHNTTIAAVVLQTAADLKLKRFIYTSSAQVYGAWGSGGRVPFAHLPMDETHPLRPYNVYSLAKVAAEQFAKLMAERHGLSVAAFRFPMVLESDPELDPRWLRYLEGEPHPSEGACTYLHASDAARAYADAIERPRPGFEAYHFVAADVWSITPIRDRLLKYNPAEPPLPPDWPPYRSPVLTTKAKEHFGWEPGWSILERYQGHTGKKLG